MEDVKYLQSQNSYLFLQVCPKPSTNQTSIAQTQRLLLPATTNVQVRASTATTAPSLSQSIRPVTKPTSTTLSQLPPGTTLISTGGNVSGVQGFALVPAQYISNVSKNFKYELTTSSCPLADLLLHTTNQF
jgi:hypothetical protein